MLYRLPFLALASLVAFTGLLSSAVPLDAMPRELMDLPPAFHRLARRAQAIEEANANAAKRAGFQKRDEDFHYYPADGFPNPNPEQLKAIENLAGGTPPEGDLPKKLDDDSLTALQLIAFNELFEVAFFNSFVNNVTNNVPGYTDFGGSAKEYILKVFKTILAQEEIHALSANAAIKAAGGTPIEPCKHYVFNANDYTTATFQADVFTALVLGTLQDVAGIFSRSESARGLTSLVVSVAANEGEQRGYYRHVAKHTPTSLPFETPASINLAYAALNAFYASSCPSESAIKLPKGNPIEVITAPKEMDKPHAVLSFKKPNGSGAKYYVTYVNQLNKPVTVEATVSSRATHPKPGYVEVTAPYPLHEKNLNGLTIAFVGDKPGPFADLQDTYKNTYASPGLIYFRYVGY